MLEAIAVDELASHTCTNSQRHHFGITMAETHQTLIQKLTRLPKFNWRGTQLMQSKLVDLFIH